MNIFAKYKNIKHLPKSILVKKFLYFFYNKVDSFFKKNKLRKLVAQYQNYEFPLINFTYLNKKNFILFEDLNKYQINRNYREEIINHNFNLFCSGMINFNRKIDYNNIEEELRTILPENFVEQSKEIIKQINDKRYKFIDWQRDFKSNYTWSEKIPAKELKYGIGKGEEVKFPWELGRLCHLVALSLYYNKDDVNNASFLVNEFQNQIFDFIAFNPPFYGIHWKSPMDISLRSLNIILSLNVFLKKGAEFSDNFIKVLSNYLYLSATYISKNMEWSASLRNNHYFANLLGLISISEIFENSNLIKKIRAKANNKIMKEIDFQFNNDGSNFEGSIAYHLFMLEMIYFVIEFNKTDSDIINNFKINKLLISKFEQILNFTSNILIDKENIPIIGDNDSGKIIYYNNIYNNLNKINYYDLILNNINNLFKDNYGINLKYNINYISHKYFIYKDIGIFNYKNDKYNIYISLGRKAQLGKGGHNHFDNTSFILYVHNKEIITDPGTYVYTSNPEMRNIFRSSSSHNRFSMDCPQNLLSKDLNSLFWLYEKPSIYKIVEENDFLSIILTYSLNNFKISRNFIFRSNTIQIIDSIPRGIVNGRIHFHFNPQIFPRIDSDDNKVQVTNEIELYFENTNKATNFNYFFSEEYGCKTTANKIIFQNLKQINSYLIKIK
jgi:hypothetical protein